MLKPLLSLYVTASSVQLSQSGCVVPCMNWSREFRKMLFFSFGTCLYVVYDVFGLITFITLMLQERMHCCFYICGICLQFCGWWRSLFGGMLVFVLFNLEWFSEHSALPLQLVVLLTCQEPALIFFPDCRNLKHKNYSIMTSGLLQLHRWFP